MRQKKKEKKKKINRKTHFQQHILLISELLVYADRFLVFFFSAMIHGQKLNVSYSVRFIHAPPPCPVLSNPKFSLNPQMSQCDLA